MKFIATDQDSPDKQRIDRCSVSFIAFPYLSLEPLRSYKMTDQSSLHPVRSLLQFHYAFEPTASRDHYQVVYNFGRKPNAIHVPQIWVLLINGGMWSSQLPNRFSLTISKFPRYNSERRYHRDLSIVRKFHKYREGHASKTGTEVGANSCDWPHGRAILSSNG